MWFGNQWFQGITGSRESLIPQFSTLRAVFGSKWTSVPLKNLGTSDSLESVVPWNHLIPSADEMTDRCPIGRYKASSLQNFYIEGRFQTPKLTLVKRFGVFTKYFNYCTKLYLVTPFVKPFASPEVMKLGKHFLQSILTNLGSNETL